MVYNMKYGTYTLVRGQIKQVMKHYELKQKKVCVTHSGKYPESSRDFCNLGNSASDMFSVYAGNWKLQSSSLIHLVSQLRGCENNMSAVLMVCG